MRKGALLPYGKTAVPYYYVRNSGTIFFGSTKYGKPFRTVRDYLVKTRITFGESQ